MQQSTIIKDTEVSSPPGHIWAGFGSCGYFRLVIRTVICQVHIGEGEGGFPSQAGTI